MRVALLVVALAVTLCALATAQPIGGPGGPTGGPIGGGIGGPVGGPDLGGLTGPGSLTGPGGLNPMLLSAASGLYGQTIGANPYAGTFTNSPVGYQLQNTLGSLGLAGASPYVNMGLGMAGAGFGAVTGGQPLPNTNFVTNPYANQINNVNGNNLMPLNNGNNLVGGILPTIYTQDSTNVNLNQLGNYGQVGRTSFGVNALMGATAFDVAQVSDPFVERQMQAIDYLRVSQPNVFNQQGQQQQAAQQQQVQQQQQPQQPRMVDVSQPTWQATGMTNNLPQQQQLQAINTIPQTIPVQAQQPNVVSQAAAGVNGNNAPQWVPNYNAIYSLQLSPQGSIAGQGQQIQSQPQIQTQQPIALGVGTQNVGLVGNSQISQQQQIPLGMAQAQQQQLLQQQPLQQQQAVLPQQQQTRGMNAPIGSPEWIQANSQFASWQPIGVWAGQPQQQPQLQQLQQAQAAQPRLGSIGSIQQPQMSQLPNSVTNPVTQPILQQQPLTQQQLAAVMQSQMLQYNQALQQQQQQQQQQSQGQPQFAVPSAQIGVGAAPVPPTPLNVNSVASGGLPVGTPAFGASRGTPNNQGKVDVNSVGQMPESPAAQALRTNLPSKPATATSNNNNNANTNSNVNSQQNPSGSIVNQQRGA